MDCYTCNGEDCSSTLPCANDEDHCIKATGKIKHKTREYSEKNDHSLSKQSSIELLIFIIFPKPCLKCRKRTELLNALHCYKENI